VRAVEAAAKAAKWIAPVGIFDFYDIGSEVREQHSRERPRNHRAEFDDTNACE
jgi:hypothetical protein